MPRPAPRASTGRIRGLRLQLRLSQLYVVYEIPAKGLGVSTTVEAPDEPQPDPRNRLGPEIGKLREQFSDGGKDLSGNVQGIRGW